MKISLIAAMGSNRVIGKENDIPWRIPWDWEYVKQITLGSPIILGGGTMNPSAGRCQAGGIS